MSRERYNKCENPLNNYSVVHDIITKFGAGEDIENFLMTYSEDRDITPLNKKDEYVFLFNKYNNILTKIRNMTEAEINEYSAKIENFAKLRNKMIKFGRIKSFDKWELLHKYDFYNSLNQEFCWENIKLNERKFKLKGVCTSDSLNLNSNNNFQHRIYISPLNQDLYKLLDSIRLNLEKYKVPYHIDYQQVLDRTDRNDKIIISTNDDYYEKTLDILDLVKKQNEGICFKCQDTPIMTSRYDNWLGLLDTNDYTINSRRIRAIETGISNAIDETLVKLKGKRCRHLGADKLFDSIIKNEMSSVILKSSSISTVNKIQLIKDIENALYSKCYEILGNFSIIYKYSLDDCKTDNETIIGEIHTKNGDIKITPTMIYPMYRKLARLCQEVDRGFDYLARIRIQDSCRENGVNPDNFAFDLDNKILQHDM